MFEQARLLEKALKLLARYPLCDYCLGRQFARLAQGMSNKQRGAVLKTVLAMEADASASLGDERGFDELRILAENGGLHQAQLILARRKGIKVETTPCHICGGLLSEERFNKLAERILEELREYEFGSFLLGASIPPDVREREDRIRSEFGITSGEDIKNDITREVGKIIQSSTNAKVSYDMPDITVIIDFFNDRFEIKSNPLFIRGSYLKHRRDLPQAVWHCRKCWGRGCPSCNYTGKEYETSVSELIGIPATSYAEALDYKFHAAGREDVDALVEGTGRPFILELKSPRRRFLDFSELERLINEHAAGAVEVRGLKRASRKEVRELKAMSPHASKTYVAEVEFDSDIDDRKLREVEERFRNIMIEQRTPTRVLARRADKLRHKTLYELRAEQKSAREVVFTIRAQGGMYIKELIDGDGGRTKPNIAEALGAKPQKISLSVVAVEA